MIEKGDSQPSQCRNASIGSIHSEKILIYKFVYRMEVTFTRIMFVYVDIQ